MRTRVALVVVLAVTSALTGRASAAEQQVPPMLVFARGGDLYRMAVDGSETARLTSTKAVEADPAVSADGFQVAFTRGTKRGADGSGSPTCEGRASGASWPRDRHA